MTFLDRLRAAFRAPVPDERMLTPSQLWGRGVTWEPLSSSGISVTAEMAMQAAVGACVRLLADDISSLPVDTIRKVDGRAVDAERPPWLDYPTGRRWDTWQAHLSDVVVSMLTDGNAFVQGIPDALFPDYLRVHDPERIHIEESRGTVLFRSGTTTWDEAEMMHIPWVRMPGKVRALSVLDASRDSAGLELAAREWAGAFFANGGTLGTIIEHPGKPTPDELDLMRASFDDRHKGARNAFRLGLVTGGGKLRDGTIKPQEAALEPLWQHVLEEAARLYHIPPHLLGSQDPGGSSFSSVEQRSIEYVQHAIVPVTTRIEHAYSRFLRDGAKLKLNVNALLRGDVKTRAAWYQVALQGKVMRPSEVRDKEDLPFDPENTGYLQTPNNTVPPENLPEEDAPQAAAIVINDVELRDEAARLLTERVTGAIAVGREQASIDIAELALDVARLGQEAAKVYAALHEMVMRQAQEREAERTAAMAPVSKEVIRDPDGRILGVIEEQGGRQVRRAIERDPDGRIVRVIEVAA